MLLQKYLKVMDLKSKFNKYNIMQLISIAETNSDYTDHAKNIAIDIINSKEKKEDINIKNVAVEYWKLYIEENIKSIILNKTLPKSHFLNDNEMREVLKSEFNKWKEKQELFGIDVTKYWATF